MGAKKMERSAAEVFLENAIREGRATEQELTIGSIVIDKALQSRVETNMEYVKHLADLIAMGVRLRAVMVFHDPKSGRYILADGFHRVAATKRQPMPPGQSHSVRAWVLQGTREDAVMYSVSANLENSKPTTIEDRRKAVRMLLATEAGRKMNATEIGRRCGMSDTAVVRQRAIYFAEMGWTMPEEVEYVQGNKVLKRPRLHHRQEFPYYYIKSGKNHAYANFGYRKRIYLGKDGPEARRKFAELVANMGEREESESSPRVKLSHNHFFVIWLAHRDIGARCIPKTNRPVVEGIIHSAFVANVVPDLSADSLYRAWGHIRALRLSVNPDLRAVVVCYPPDNLNDLIDLACRDGVEFLTPEQVVEQFGGKDPESGPSG